MPNKDDLTGEELIKHMQKQEDYLHVKILPGLGLCGIRAQLYTVAVVIGIDQEGSYEGRYCYPGFLQAVAAFKNWDGQGDPLGDWVKYKGIGGERRNPLRNKVEPSAPMD